MVNFVFSQFLTEKLLCFNRPLILVLDNFRLKVFISLVSTARI